MKKRYLLVSVLLAVFGLALADQALNAKAPLVAYINPEHSRSNAFVNILANARIMEISDVRGMYAQFGDRNDLKGLIKDEERAETEAYGRVEKTWFTPPSYTQYKQCVVQMHAEHYAALSDVKRVLSVRMGSESNLKVMLKSVLAYTDLRTHCILLVQSDEIAASGSAHPKLAATAGPPASPSKPAQTPSLSMKERFVPLLSSVPVVGDPEGTQSEIDVLSHPKTLEDWRFLASLDEEWGTTDCSAAMCASHLDTLGKAEALIKKNNISPPPGVVMKFRVLAMEVENERLAHAGGDAP